MDRNLLEKKRERFRFSALAPDRDRRAGANPPELRRAGFDVLVDSGNPIRNSSGPLSTAGLMLMKRVDGATASDGPQRVLDQMTNYPLRQSVAFWHIGDRLGRQREIKVREDEVAKIRDVDRRHPGSGRRRFPFDDRQRRGRTPALRPRPRDLDIDRDPASTLGAAQELLESYDYFIQRRLLTVRSNLGAFSGPGSRP